jgi:LEA14-like dessication related protein
MKYSPTKLIAILLTIGSVFLFLGLMFSKPKFNGIQSLKITELHDGTLLLMTSVRMDNDNFFSIRGKEISTELYLGQQLFARGKSGSFNLKKLDSTNVNLSFEFYLDSLKAELTNLLLKDSIQITAKSRGTFSLLNLNVEDEQQIWFKSKDLIDPLVKNSMKEKGVNFKFIQLIGLDLEHTTFGVAVDFTNNLPIEITLKDFQFSVLSEKQDSKAVADWQFQLNKTLKPNQIETLSGEAKVDNANAIFSGMNKILKGKTDGYLRGTATISLDGRMVKIPINQHFEMNLLTKEITILKDYYGKR